MNDGLPYERAAEGHVSRPPSAGVPGSQHSEANAVAWQSWLPPPPPTAPPGLASQTGWCRAPKRCFTHPEAETAFLLRRSP